MTVYYEPGTIAMVTALNRTEPYRAAYDGDTWRELAGLSFCVNSPTSIRPLVVLDLNEQSITRVGEVLRDAGLNVIAGMIEEQARPPKPAEPTGLGAVVEDAEGERWVRVNQRTGTQEWRCCDFNGEFRRWPAIAAVRVLSEGVRP